jgi:Spore germination protein.
MKYRFYYILLIVTILSHLLLYAPYELNKNLLKGSFTAVFAACILGCFNAYMLIYVYNSYKKQNLIEINKVLFGKFIGNLLSLGYIIVSVAVSFFMYRGIVEIGIRTILPSTPVWFVSIIVLLIYFVSLQQDNRSFLSFIGFVSLFIIFWYSLQILMSLKVIRFYNITGGIIHSLKVPNFNIIAAAGFYFTGVSHLALFNPEFSTISWKRTCLIYCFFGIPVALTSIYIPVGIWGPHAVQKNTVSSCNHS